MFNIDLQSQITAYTRQQPNWGGAACCKMAMNGYPSGAVSCNINQSILWNYIQSHNKEPGLGPWGIGWYADPYAITKTLNDLCPPKHSWVDVSGTDRNSVLYTLLRYMANYRYASLVCTFAHDYWLTLVYFKTSADPRTVTNPTLQRIGFYSPATASYSEIDGSVWMSSPAYWGSPCNGHICGQLWDNKWVGIGEPPEVDGSVEVESISRIGKKLIEPKEIKEIAAAVVAERLEESSESLERQLTGVSASSPLLVRELQSECDQRSGRGARYYVVPFGNKYEHGECHATIARFTVLINAFTGRFEELTVFTEPQRYLSGEQALNIASRSLGFKARELPGVNLELVSQPWQSEVSCAVPAWSITIGDRTIFITQQGRVIGNLSFPTYKGG